MNGERMASRAGTGDKALVIQRLIDAPREVIWAALTDQMHAGGWWAPRGCVVTYLLMDVRPGGTWRKCMRTPAGDEVCNGGVYTEVMEPERLSFTYAVHERETLVTFTLAEHHEKTRLTLRHSPFELVADRDSHRDGWTSTVERLVEHVMSR